MKKLSFLVLGLFGFFFTLNVNALDVSSLSELKECLDGAESTCTVKSELLLTTGSETLNLNNKTVVLEKSIYVSDEASLTINGNGNVQGTVATGLINVKKGGTVTVNGGIFKNEASAAKCFGIYGSVEDDKVKTTLTIAEGVKLSANFGILVGRAEKSTASYGVVVNYAGDFQAITGNNEYYEGTIGITTNGYIKATSGNVPVINITGGSIKTVEGTTDELNDDDAPAIYAGGYAVWNISAGTLEASEALSIKAGEFNVTGGTLKAFGKKAKPEQFDDGSEATGAAISITANKEYAKAVVLNIKEATVESKNAAAIFEGKSDDTNTAISVIEISGGEFTGKDKVLDIENVGKFVTGGTYSSDLSTSGYLSDKANYVCKEIKEGNYSVGIEKEISIAVIENGKVAVDKEKALEGETITVTVTADKGFVLKNIIVKDADDKEIEVTDNKFVMPESNVTITATFEKVEYEIAIETVENGKVDVSNKKVVWGEEVLINVTADEGYLLKALIVKGADDKEIEVTDNKFVMPESNVEISATFEKVEYEIAIETVENGKVDVSNKKIVWGEEVEITVTADEGYLLQTLIAKDENDKELVIIDNKFVMPESNVIITAIFEKITADVEIPVLDPEKEVENVIVGVIDSNNKVEQVLLESIKEDSDLSEKIKDKNINVVVDIAKVDDEKLPEEVKKSIEEKAGKATIAEYFDISIIVKDANNGTEIDKLANLKEEIELMILLPENLKNTNEKVDREYLVIREHDGRIDEIKAELSEDGNYLVFKSKNFSTYALAYLDSEKIENPKTGDNIVLYSVLGILSIAGLTIVIKKRKFN